jgi:serine/threonine-protein kinase
MKRFFRGLLIFLALIVVGIVSAFAVVALLLRQEEVRVPDFTGQEIVTVIEALNEQGLQLKIDRRESSTQPRDTVIAQTPPPGSGIKKGRQVHLVLSLGPSEMQTPRVAGEHFRKADVMLRQEGFFPGNVARVSSDTVERDIVIAQSPQAGSSLEKGGRVDLLISSGRRSEQLVTPRLTGKNPEEAARIIDRMGLQYRVAYRSGSDKQQAADRVVLLQKPAAVSPVAEGGTVEIVVSK